MFKNQAGFKVSCMRATCFATNDRGGAKSARENGTRGLELHLEVVACIRAECGYLSLASSIKE